jgi:Cep192 domain 4
MFAVAAMLCATPGAIGAQRHHRYGGHGSSQGQLRALSCGQASLTGAGTDACTVSLAQAAGSGGLTVSLSSSSGAVRVPASVTVASGASSTAFTATASAVTSAQTVTLAASDSSNSQTYALQLKPAASGTAALTLGSTSVAFGSVSLNTPSTQTVQLSSTGTSALTISGATIQGTGFTMSGITTPLTLSPSQTATLNLQFDPKVAGNDTGAVMINSNAASGGTSTIALAGTGTTAGGYEVQLNWAAPASSGDAVAGYNVYRAANGGAYQKLNTSANQPATYTDTTVQSGTTYTYEVMSVDASGVQSAPSNVYSAAVP